ncbi:MAG: TVP38/TMEM64 family protein [Alphaproteobacteria bacterium]|nr:TVP38/TMEM64 family protein [Alphaproteobacteria bacterium]
MVANTTTPLKRWLPAGLLLAGIAIVYLTGLYRHLSFESFVTNGAAIEAFVHQNLVAAILLYGAVYVAVVAFSLPGAAAMSIIGGFLFGWMTSVPVTIAAATAGAVIVFQIVKTSFGTALAERAGPLVQKLSHGFAADAFNYLLFLRLVPLFPFFMVNAVAGLCSVRLKTFVAATVIGIIPGSIAFAYLGTGLGSVIDAQKAAQADCIATNGAAECRFELDPSLLITRELAIAFVVLGCVALLPIGLKRLKKSARSGAPY